MIDIRDLEVKVLTLAHIEHYEKEGYFELMELNKLDPYPTEDELYALGNSIISTGFNNKTDPIVIYKGKIADGKSRFKAMKRIKSNEFHIAIIPSETKESEVNDFIMKTQTRRDKTKTQKAISAYMYHKLSPTSRLYEVAKLYGISERSVKSVRFLDVAGFSDVIDTLHQGGVYTYEAFNNSTGEVTPKKTTSVSVVEKILKGKQKDMDVKGSAFDELDGKSSDTNPQLMEVFDMLSKLSDNDMKLLRDKLLKGGSDE